MTEIVRTATAPGAVTIDPRYAYAMEIRAQLVADADATIAETMAKATRLHGRNAVLTLAKIRRQMEDGKAEVLRQFDAKLKRASGNLDPATGTREGVEEDAAAELAGILGHAPR